jgi:hypothetical protein
MVMTLDMKSLKFWSKIIGEERGTAATATTTVARLIVIREAIGEKLE